MKKKLLPGVLIALPVVLSLLFGSLMVQEKLNDNRKTDLREEVYLTKGNDLCKNLEEYLTKEFSKGTKPLKDNASVRVFGLQEKDAVVKALELCSRLNAKKEESESEDLVYKLPDGLGSIVIQEVYEDEIFLKLSFITDCKELPFTGIWYVSLKRYHQR